MLLTCCQDDSIRVRTFEENHKLESDGWQYSRWQLIRTTSWRCINNSAEFTLRYAESRNRAIPIVLPASYLIAASVISLLLESMICDTDTARRLRKTYLCNANFLI